MNPFMALLNKFLSFVVVFFLLVPAALAAEKINDVYVVHFVLDGTNKAAFDAALTEGALPTIQRTFVENGAVFEQGLSEFPTTSTTIYQSYVTGLWSGNSGIPHLERFDRYRKKVIGYLTAGGYKMMNSDFLNVTALLQNPDVETLQAPTTIFELLNGLPTAAVYAPFSLGASHIHPKSAPIHALWSTYATEEITKVSALAFDEIEELYGGPFDKIPRYTIAGLYSPDILGHKFGPQSAEVKTSLVHFDIFLQNFCEILKNRNLLDKTYIIVSADHGMHGKGRHFNLRNALAEKGFFMKPANPRVKKYALYASNRGVSSAHIYMKEQRDMDAVSKALLKMPEADIVITKAGYGAISVMNGLGQRADISCYKIGIKEFCAMDYDKDSGDPFGYSNDPSLSKLLDGEPHESKLWKTLTSAKEYPDAVMEVSHLFNDGRAGEIFIVTKEEFGFRKAKAGNHGGAKRGDMNTPLLMAGPSVPKGKFGAARPVDINTLLIKWFGIIEPKENHDGEDPFDSASNEDRTAQALAAVEHAIVRDDITKAMAAARRAGAARLCNEELERREKLTNKLSRLVNGYDAKKVDKRYAEDHKAVLELQLARALDAVERMKQISLSLRAKRSNLARTFFDGIASSLRSSQ